MKSNADQPKDPESKPGSKSDAKDDLKTLPMPEVEKKLNSSPDGLTQAEAEKRLTQYGPNEIKEKKINPILKFLTYFWGPIPWMIEIAVILSAAVRHWEDFGIILFLLICNAVVGFWEEHQAGNAIDALKARLAIKARVKRDGKWVNPAARELVPGDVIRLRLGDIVPADARLLEGDEVSVDQSALTGESLPATRKPGEAVFSGSIMRRGEIGALVYATGTNTYFGKTAQLVERGAHRQPFSTGRPEDRQVPDRPRIGSGGGDCYRRFFPRRTNAVCETSQGSCPLIRSHPHGRGHSSGHAYGVVGDDGRRRAPARQEASDREQVGGHRGIGGRGRAVRGQDRHPDPEQADAGRSVHSQWYPCRPGHPCRRTGFARKTTTQSI